MKYLILLCLWQINQTSCRLRSSYYFEEESKSRNDLFSSKGRHEVCDNKSPEIMFALRSEFNCMKERMARLKLENLQLIKSCWKDVLNINYPESDETMAQVFCKDFHIPLNIANDCVIREVISLITEKEYPAIVEKVKKLDDNDKEFYFSQKTIKNIKYLSQCADGTNVVNNDFAMLVDKYSTSISLQKYLESYRSKIEQKGSSDEENPSKEYCNDKDDLSNVVKTVSCILTAYPKQTEGIELCWNEVMFGFSLPKTEDDWKNVVCDNKTEQPLALLKEFEACVTQSLPMHGKSKCIQDTLLNKYDAYDYWQVKMASFYQIQKFYQICRKKNMTSFKDEMSYNSFKCLIDKEAAKNATFNLLLKYCWKREAGTTGRKVRKSWPMTEDDWFQYYCDEAFSNGKKYGFPEFESIVACVSDLINLSSRSVFYVDGNVVYDPEQSQNEKAALDCLPRYMRDDFGDDD